MPGRDQRPSAAAPATISPCSAAATDACKRSQTANGQRPRGRARQRAFMIAVVPDGQSEEQLSELRELLRTAGVADVGELVQRRDHPHPNTYLGPGKVDELKAALAGSDANLVACDDELLAAPGAQPRVRARRCR